MSCQQEWSDGWLATPLSRGPARLGRVWTSRQASSSGALPIDPSVRLSEPIEAAGADLRFLPPYSPALSPIELVLSKIKQRPRSLACQTVKKLWSLMQSLLDNVAASDAANCFRHCGYTLRMG